MKITIKRLSILICLILCISIAFSFSGSIFTKVDANEGLDAKFSNEIVEVWGAPSSVKIRRDEINYGNKKGCSLIYNAVKGEYESYQLVMSAKADINSYSLDVVDLTDGIGNTISADCFEVYNEYYTKVNFVSTPNSKVGAYYPDALVPMNLAKEAGELKIAKDNNGAFWVTVHIPEDAVAGQYSGVFTLKINDKTISVPVSLRVFDYLLTEDSHFTTLFNAFDKGLANGEKDTTIEMKQLYYDYFLDYRINLDRYPTDSLDTDELVAQAKKYANDNRVRNYVLPFSTTGGCFLNVELFRSQILALAKESTPEVNLLAKASVYIIDEPEGNNMTQTAIDQCKQFNTMLGEVVTAIESDITGAFDTFKSISNWESLIIDMRNVITCQFGSSEMYQLYNTWCPGWDKWFTQEQIDANTQIVTDLKNDLNLEKEIWWYGCMSPKDPHPQYHLDSDLLSSRAVNWLAQAYDVEGLLYWRVMAEGNTDVYDTPAFAMDKLGVYPSGDGYLVYPGFKYGHRGPLPSMRLMSVRDGLEEYELIYALQEKYNTYSYSGVDVKEAIHNIYSGIHNCIDTTKDIDLFDTVRTELLSITEIDCGKDAKFVFEAIDKNNDVVKIRLDSSKYELKINDNTVTPSGDTFTYQLNGAIEIEISIINKTDANKNITFTKSFAKGI